MAEPRANSMRVTKRSSGHGTNEHCKRRARYAPRACDACRRRKGRCDGRKPCEYCQDRGMECCYSVSVNSEQQHRGIALIPGSGDNAHQHQPLEGLTWTPDKVNSISGLVASLQGQLDTLVAHVKLSSEGQSSQAGALPPPINHNDNSNVNLTMVEPNASVIEPPLAANSSKRATQRFYGPTSPDYSLNVAQMKMQQGKYSGTEAGRQRDPSIDNQTDDDDPALSQEDENSTLHQPMRQSSRQGLFQFQSLLTKREAVRLLYVYQEVIGDLHPILDIERLVEQTEGWYNWPGIEQSTRGGNESLSDENSLLILNLVLLIALCAESVSQSEVGKTLYNSCRDIINVKLASPATSVKHVTITLLVGVYHFFMGTVRLAWRMCGLAGRMAMELGLHSQNVSQHFLENDRQRSEVIILLCSLIVLDRQWSAAAGLPSNFQISDFDHALGSSVNTPYLKAMIAFTVMSHKFNEPISRVATGGTYDDDDAFEVTKFQIEQWRKKALDKHNFTHPGTWETTPSARPPSWTTLLYLRANAVRGILLRPFFLSNSTTSASKRNVQPGLEIVSDTINVLSILDRTTDIYRKQHPLFQHFLATSCALLFLIVAYVEQNRATSSSESPTDFADSVARNFKKALTLAAAYSNSSRESRKLWKRLGLMREPLLRLGILSRDDCPGDSTLTTSVPRQSTAGNISKTQEKAQTGQQVTFSNYGMDDQPFLEDSMEGFGSSNMDDNPNVGWFDFSVDDWPLNDTATFF